MSEEEEEEGEEDEGENSEEEEQLEDEAEMTYNLRKRRPVIYQYQPVIQASLIVAPTHMHTLCTKSNTSLLIVCIMIVQFTGPD